MIATPARIFVWSLAQLIALAAELPGGSLIERLAEEIGARLSAIEGLIGGEPRGLGSLEEELRRIAVAVEAIPALRDDLAALPETIAQLESRMSELFVAISQLMGSVEELAAATHPLHAATEKLEELEHRARSERPARRWMRGAERPT